MTRERWPFWFSVAAYAGLLWRTALLPSAAQAAARERESLPRGPRAIRRTAACLHCCVTRSRTSIHRPGGHVRVIRPAADRPVHGFSPRVPPGVHLVAVPTDSMSD